jgi:hypothetical protein
VKLAAHCLLNGLEPSHGCRTHGVREIAMHS